MKALNAPLAICQSPLVTKLGSHVDIANKNLPITFMIPVQLVLSMNRFSTRTRSFTSETRATVVGVE